MFTFAQYKQNEAARDILRAVFDAAIVHTRGAKPEKLLGLRRPSEPEEIMEYRLGVYEPITRADFRQAIADAKRALLGGKARLVMGEKVASDIEAMKPDGLPFVAWVRERVLPVMFEDPNASITFWPINPGDNTPIQAEIEVVHSFDFVERSPVFLKWQAGVTDDNEPIFRAVDETYFWLIIGTGQKERATVHYAHNMGRLPVVYELGGIPAMSEDGFQYLESYFCSAFAWGNKTIRYDSDLEGCKTLVAYPVREIEEEPCQNPVCTNGYWYNEKKKDREICPSCNGKGVHIPSGPFAYIVKKKANNVTGEGATSASRPAMSYITPPVEGLRFLQEDFRAAYDTMRQTLNQLHIASAQSGTAKEIDREGKHAAIDAIGANLWENVIKKAVEVVRDLRYWPIQQATGVIEEVAVVLPETFRTITEADLQMEAAAAVASGDRLGALKASTEAQAKRYGTDAAHLKMLAAWNAYNPLPGYTLEEKMDMATAGMGAALGFTPADLVRSGKGEHILRQMQAEPGFAQMEIADIIAEADRRLGLSE